MKRFIVLCVTMFVLTIGSYSTFITKTVSACGCGCGIYCGGRCGCRCSGCETADGFGSCVTCCDQAREATGPVAECGAS